METPEWVTKASCRQIHGDFFFPPMDVENPEKHYDVARAVCASCPVWQQCLAAGQKEVWGMWGGLTPHERIPMRDKHKVKHLAPKGTFRRFRQGSRLIKCTKAHEDACAKPYDLTLVPKLGVTYDIDLVHTELFQHLGKVE